ncbi:MAG: glycosyltransferase [Candidatus Omnitrophica bacterium]|nr:glycosyltransferase [Candidatus Omnitrophota bacterium]
MNRTIKILHAITRLDRGGSSENTLLSCIGLAERGYKVDLLFGRTADPDIDLMKRARTAGVNFIEEEDLIRDIHPVKDLSAFFDIVGFIRRENYDIVHAHSSKAGFICRVAAKIAGAGKIVYTPHGHVFYGYFGKIMTRMVVFVESLLSRITDSIIGLTQAECEEWISYGVGREDQYTSIPSGVDFARFKHAGRMVRGVREEFGIPGEALLVVSMGRFVEVKGFRFFINAAVDQVRKRDDVFFLLAGEGPLRPVYKALINNAGASDRIKLVRWQEETADILGDADIFVLPSLNEGMGRVVVEAMYFKKPVIATRVGGVPSLVGDDAGILVPPASEKDISSALDILFSEPKKRKDMGDAGRKRVLEGFSCDRMISELDRLYSRLTA